MTKIIKVAPSILSADFADMGKAVENAEKWGADYIHFDVMDGNFVPNITFGPDMCKAIKKHTSLPIDVHLMVENPSSYIDKFKDSGADIITFHIEADRHAHRTIQLIKNNGLKAGVVLNPATPVCMVEELIDCCDMILVMSVNPGAGGQKFIENSIEKIRKIRELANKKNPDLDIEVDGGINGDNAKLCIEAGANILVAGSSVFKSINPADTIMRIRGN